MYTHIIRNFSSVPIKIKTNDGSDLIVEANGGLTCTSTQEGLTALSIIHLNGECYFRINPELENICPLLYDDLKETNWQQEGF